jgi:hypothetical protein
MRRWLALAVLVPVGAMAQAPMADDRYARADSFDLGSLMARADFIDEPKMADSDRWLPADISPPPALPHKPPMFRWRGKKVKMRLSF